MSRPYTRVLVTGAHGFIGRRICQRLQERGVHVVALVRRDDPIDADKRIVGDHTWPYVHVENLVDAVELALDHPAAAGNSYTVVDGHTTWGEYVARFAYWLAVTPGRREPREPYESFRGRFSTDRIQRDLGYAPRVGYEAVSAIVDPLGRPPFDRRRSAVLGPSKWLSHWGVDVRVRHDPPLAFREARTSLRLVLHACHAGKSRDTSDETDFPAYCDIRVTTWWTPGPKFFAFGDPGEDEASPRLRDQHGHGKDDADLLQIRLRFFRMQTGLVSLGGGQIAKREQEDRRLTIDALVELRLQDPAFPRPFLPFDTLGGGLPPDVKVLDAMVSNEGVHAALLVVRWTRTRAGMPIVW